MSSHEAQYERCVKGLSFGEWSVQDGDHMVVPNGYSFKSSKYLARVFSRFRGSALTDEEYQAALQDLVKGLNESRCKSLSHPKVYMYTEASDEHDAVAAGLAMKDHVDSDEEGIEVEEEVWIGNGEGPGPDPLSGGGCFVYTFFYSSPEQQEQQQKQQQLLLQQQQEEEEESEQEEEEYNDCTPDLDSIMWEKKPPNRARIAFPFSSIRGLAFDGQSYAVHFQLTEPPRTWVGTQALTKRQQKSPTWWKRKQQDFSGGPIKRSCVHTLTLGEQSFPRFCSGVVRTAPSLIMLASTPESKALLTAEGRRAAAAAAGDFSDEQVAASMDTAPARPKSQHADGGASGAPAAARCPAQRAPGWLPDVPTLAEGSWAQRSIARWGLTPPYDSAATEEQWQAYYKERRALELIEAAYREQLRGVPSAPQQPPAGPRRWDQMDFATVARLQAQEHAEHHGDQRRVASSIDWAAEGLEAATVKFINRESYADGHECEEAVDFIDENREAVRRVLVGCKDLPEAEGLAQRMSAGTYLLNFFIYWEDSYGGEPRSMDQTTRFYSPFATPNAVEVQYIWYMKRGFSHGQWYYSWKAYARGPDKAKPLQPQESILSKCRTIKNMRNLYLLYDMTYDDDNFRENRRLPTMHALTKLQEHLLGHSDLLSGCKMFSVLCKGGCSWCHGFGSGAGASSLCKAFQAVRGSIPAHPGDDTKDEDCGGEDSSDYMSEEESDEDDDEEEEEAGI